MHKKEKCSLLGKKEAGQSGGLCQLEVILWESSALNEIQTSPPTPSGFLTQSIHIVFDFVMWYR